MADPYAPLATTEVSPIAIDDTSGTTAWYPHNCCPGTAPTFLPRPVDVDGTYTWVTVQWDLAGQDEPGFASRLRHLDRDQPVTIVAARVKAGSRVASHPRLHASTSFTWWGSWLAAASSLTAGHSALAAVAGTGGVAAP